MRLRSVVLPVVVACAAAVAVPTSAAAAPSQCSLVMPTKVVVAAATTEMDFYVASNCTTNGADHANWRLGHGSGTSGPIDLDAAGIEARDYFIEWYDDDPMGTWYLKPTGSAKADTTPLTQNSTTIAVKYASKLTTKVTRTSTKLTWAVTASTWSGRAHAYYPRANAPVSLFHRAPGSTTWKYVKSVTASRTGKATVTMTNPKAGSYRLGMGETGTAWAGWTTPIAGKI